MFIRRLLALLCSLFLVFCVAWPGAYAVEVPDLDDMGIDPWGDLGLIQETSEPVPTAPIGEPAGEWEEVYDLDQDAGIMMTAGEDIGLMSVQFKLWTLRFPDSAPHSLFSLVDKPVYPWSVKKSFVSRSFSWTDYSPYNSSDNRSPRLHFLDSFMNSPYYGTYLVQNYSSYGSVIRLSNLNINASVSSRLSIYGKLIGDIQFYDHWYANNLYWFGESPLYTVKPYFASYSFDGVNFIDFTSDEFNSSTGEFNFVTDLDRSLSEIYIKFSYFHEDNPFFKISEPGTGISNTGTYAFLELDHTQFHIEGLAASGGVDEETKGLLATIIEWLTSIRDGIVNVGTAIVQLPGKIANLIIEGIKSLFIPSEDDLIGIKDQYTQLLEERLGFVWQAGEMVISFGQSVLSAFETATDFQFEFPGVSFELPELGQVTLIEPQVVSVDNAFMDVMQPVLGTIVSFICVLAFINTAERMVVAVVSGVSYFHFLKGD